MTAPISPLTQKTESRNSRMGMIGSGTTHSTTTKRIAEPTAPRASPRATREPHAYSVPPQLVSSTAQVENSDRNSAPR
ncbi:hypothetical protein SANTM175S_01478 [Streptomyces antimycoticus]